MSNLELVSTSVDKVIDTLTSVDAERTHKKELIENNVTFPTTAEDKLAVINAYATAAWLELKSDLMSNKAKDYAFVWRPWQDKKQAQIWIFKDSNLWRLEVTWSRSFVKLWYANTSSDTWFSMFAESQS